VKIEFGIEEEFGGGLAVLPLKAQLRKDDHPGNGD
jgi:hypothetical protein